MLRFKININNIQKQKTKTKKTVKTKLIVNQLNDKCTQL